MQVTETLSAGLKREYKVVVNQAELDQRAERQAGGHVASAPTSRASAPARCRCTI